MNGMVAYNLCLKASPSSSLDQSLTRLAHVPYQASMGMMAGTMTPSSTAPQQTSWLIDQQRGISVACPAAIMGIINATPDSFSDGGKHASAENAINAGCAMVTAGAAWLDVGGESSRPGAEPISAQAEIERVVPIISGLRAAGIQAPISIDTTKASVARAAMDAGASAINDISAGSDPELFTVAAAYGCPLILMHMRGTPATMQIQPHYQDVVAEVSAYLEERIQAAQHAGVAASSILIDPGIGFGKTVAHNIALLRALPRLVKNIARPFVVGVSRKSFLPLVAGLELLAAERDGLSHIVHGLIADSCALLRVHDVPGAVAATRLHRALIGGADAL